VSAPGAPRLAVGRTREAASVTMLSSAAAGLGKFGKSCLVGIKVFPL
jgi:hypothetical protein